jgi:hypothetical protein
MCFVHPLYLFFLWAVPLLSFIAVYTYRTTRKAKAACVGRYSEFWFTFLVYHNLGGNPLYDSSTFLTCVDPRDVEVLLAYRRRLAWVTVGVFFVSGLAFLVIASSCQTWTGPAGGLGPQVVRLTAPAGLCVSRTEG